MDTKKKVFKLKVDQQSYSIIAISSAESLLKLAWHINTALGIKLTEGESIHIPTAEEGTLNFPAHKYYNDAKETQYSLIKNRVDRALLVKSYSKVDFFFKISGEDHSSTSLNCIKLIKTIPGIIAVIPIDINKVRVFSVFDTV
jgi:hypothetical protein